MLQMSLNDGQCVLWILVNTAYYFPHVETIFIGHIHINYPLLECGCWILNCICAWSGCLILQTLQKLSTWDLKRNFEDRWVHISFFRFLYIYIMSLYPTQWWSQVYVWQLCVIIVVLVLVHNFDCVFYNKIRSRFENTVYEYG